MTEKTQIIHWLEPIGHISDLPKGPFTRPTACVVNGAHSMYWCPNINKWYYAGKVDMEEHLEERAHQAEISPFRLTALGFNEADVYFGAGEFVHPKMPMFGLTPQFGADGGTGYDLYLLRPKECFILGKRGTFKAMGQVKDFYALMGLEL